MNEVFARIKTLTLGGLHLRQASRNELVASMLARRAAHFCIGRIRLPEYNLSDDGGLRLVPWVKSGTWT